jgi:hypothetical protein
MYVIHVLNSAPRRKDVKESGGTHPGILNTDIKWRLMVRLLLHVDKEVRLCSTTSGLDAVTKKQIPILTWTGLQESSP